MISLSEIIPRARNTIKSGTGDRTFGIFTTICLFVYLLVGAHIFTENVRTGFDAFSETHRISAEYRYLSSSTFLIYNILSANFSCATTVFSLPSIIKYPPKSFLHSPNVCLVCFGKPFKIQKSD